MYWYGMANAEVPSSLFSAPHPVDWWLWGGYLQLQIYVLPIFRGVLSARSLVVWLALG